MAKPIIIIGSGGHAKVLAAALLTTSAQILGLTDSNQDRHGATLYGIPILGDDKIINNYSPDSIELVNGLGSIDIPLIRKNVFLKFKQLGYNFASVIHPNALIAMDVQLGEGVQVMAGSIIQPGCLIGDNTIINTKASIDHDCQIASHVHISPGVTTSGGVTIGSDTHIGTAATLIQQVNVGKNVLIGAGSVILKDIADGERVKGVY